MIIRKSNKQAQCAVAVALALCLALPCTAQEEEVDLPTTDEQPAEVAEPTPAEEPGETPTAVSEEDVAAPSPVSPTNPRRANSFTGALEVAKDDGVAVYCYGPDWNQRSVRRLKDFWMSQELEAATGEAILVAVPYYESPNDEQRTASANASAGMKAPAFGVCPTVLLFDKDGTLYAELPGMDNLGTEGNFEVGYKNIRTKMAAMNKRAELMKKLEATSAGVEKAKILNEIAELPIKNPASIVDSIREADPGDQSGMVRRNSFKQLDFLYEQMHTKDGFLSPDFKEDYKEIEAACMRVIKDTAMRAEDRQAAYLLLIGASRRQEITGAKLKSMIHAFSKIAPDTKYGKLAPFLADKWASLKYTHTSEERARQRKQEREKNKERKARERDEKKAARSNDVR